MHGIDHRFAADGSDGFWRTRQAVDPDKQPGSVIGGTSEHCAIKPARPDFNVGQRLEPAIQFEVQRRKLRGEAMHDLVSKRRHFAVLLRAQPIEPGVARVHDEALATRPGELRDEVGDEPERFASIDADAVLDGHWQVDRILHRAHAPRNQCRACHQAGAERTLADPIARAAAVEVDLAIPVSHCDPCGVGQFSRIAPPQLQHRAFTFVAQREQRIPIAVQDRLAGDHLRIQPGTRAQRTMKAAAMAIGPVHHRGNRQAPGLRGKDGWQGWQAGLSVAVETTRERRAGGLEARRART